MRLLIINQHPSDVFGGSEMQCDLLAHGLTGHGHEVVYGAVGSRRKAEYTALSYRVVPLAIEKSGELTRLLQQEKPDIIYWRFNKHHLLRAVRESRKNNIPFVFAVSHVNDIKKYAHLSTNVCSGWLNRFRSLISNISNSPRIINSAWNYQAFHDIAAVTTNNSQYLGELPVKKQRVIWNSVSEKKRNFEWEKPYCAWVANIKPPKRPEAYIELAAIMTRRCPEIDFLMFGAIQDEHYRSILKAAEKNSNFHYLGFYSPETVNGVLDKAICLVHTCKREGFPNNFIQAWMMGCPTVTLEFDPDGLIQQEKLGFLSGTIEQMAIDVEMLIKNNIRRNEIGNRAQTFARAHFRPERMVAEAESLLQEVVDEHKNR